MQHSGKASGPSHMPSPEQEPAGGGSSFLLSVGIGLGIALVMGAVFFFAIEAWDRARQSMANAEPDDTIAVTQVGSAPINPLAQAPEAAAPQAEQAGPAWPTYADLIDLPAYQCYDDGDPENDDPLLGAYFPIGSEIQVGPLSVSAQNVRVQPAGPLPDGSPPPHPYVAAWDIAFTNSSASHAFALTKAFPRAGAAVETYPIYITGVVDDATNTLLEGEWWHDGAALAQFGDAVVAYPQPQIGPRSQQPMTFAAFVPAQTVVEVAVSLSSPASGEDGQTVETPRFNRNEVMWRAVDPLTLITWDENRACNLPLELPPPSNDITITNPLPPPFLAEAPADDEPQTQAERVQEQFRINALGGEEAAAGEPTPTPEPLRLVGHPLKTPSGSAVITRGFGCVEALSSSSTQRSANCPPDRPYFHNGVDYSAPFNSEYVNVLPNGGYITMVKYDPDLGPGCEGSGYGNYIRHTGLIGRHRVTLLGAHLAGVTESVLLNTFSASLSVLGWVGNSGCSTGPHLHFTVIVDGQYIDPLTLID